MPVARTSKLFLLAAAVTVAVGAMAALTPSLPGDVAVARAIQAAVPHGGWVGVIVSTAYAPQKFALMALALGAAFYFGGLRAAVVVLVAIGLEQAFGETSKAVFTRPRPSPDLIAVAGTPSGYSFPSTFMTLYCVTSGSVLLLAWRARPSGPRSVALAVSAAALLVGALARVVPGAHWPSDVLGTCAICLTWLYASASRWAPPAAIAALHT